MILKLGVYMIDVTGNMNEKKKYIHNDIETWCLYD